MDKIEQMLGYPPTREARLEILRISQEEGISIAQVVGEGRVVKPMPELLITDKTGTFWCMEQQRRLTPEEYKKTHPLGEWAPLVIIGPRK